MDFFAKIAWHYLCQEGRKNAHFRAHYLLFAQKSFWTKFHQNSETRKTIKIVVSAEIAQTKNDTFLEEGVFLTWVKKWVLLIVFLKSYVLLKTLFYCVFRKHSSCNKKAVCWKNRKYMKIVGCFCTWQNGVFWFVPFEVFMVLWFLFVCLVKLQKC